MALGGFLAVARNRGVGESGVRAGPGLVDLGRLRTFQGEAPGIRARRAARPRKLDFRWAREASRGKLRGKSREQANCTLSDYEREGGRGRIELRAVRVGAGSWEDLVWWDARGGLGAVGWLGAAGPCPELGSRAGTARGFRGCVQWVGQMCSVLGVMCSVFGAMCSVLG